MAQRLANRPCGGRYGDVAQAIGNTPAVELDDVAASPNAPGFSRS
jgi:hypothetical protein